MRYERDARLRENERERERELRVLQPHLRTHPHPHPVKVGMGSTAGSPDAVHSALLPTPISGGGVRLHHAHSTSEVVYGRVEDEYRDREREELVGMSARGGRIMLAPPMQHQHPNAQLVIPNSIPGGCDCTGRISPGAR